MLCIETGGFQTAFPCLYNALEHFYIDFGKWKRNNAGRVVKCHKALGPRVIQLTIWPKNCFLITQENTAISSLLWKRTFSNSKSLLNSISAINEFAFAILKETKKQNRKSNGKLFFSVSWLSTIMHCTHQPEFSVKWLTSQKCSSFSHSVQNIVNFLTICRVSHFQSPINEKQ